MNRKGFSTIELLIVIGSIALLALVGISALNGSRAKARDAKRVADIRQLQTALQLYYSDENEYPAVERPLVLGTGVATKLCDKASGGFVASDAKCTTTYMQEVPADPIPGSQFSYAGTTSGFDIAFQMEAPSYLGAAGAYHAHSMTIDAQAGDR